MVSIAAFLPQQFFIMWKIRILVLTIVTSFASFELTQTTPVRNFTLEQYMGIWYEMGLLLPGRPGSEILCDWFNVKPKYGNCPGCFDERYGKLVTGKMEPRVDGIGIFNGTFLIIAYPTLFHGPLEFSVSSHNNGNELILSTPGDMKYSRLLSRNATISPEVKEAFDNMAGSAGQLAIYANPAKCAA